MTQEPYKTSDMTIASVLAYFGQEMIDIDKTDKGDIEFIFRQSENLSDLVKAYMLDEISVSPKRFSVVLRDIKKILYTAKKSNN